MVGHKQSKEEEEEEEKKMRKKTPSFESAHTQPAQPLALAERNLQILLWMSTYSTISTTKCNITLKFYAIFQHNAIFSVLCN